MQVYRLCKKDELYIILKKNFYWIGKKYSDNDKINNFHYLPEVKYVHFFEKKENILYLNGKKGYYICTYNIPEEILLDHKGVGYYLDFINFRKVEKIDEYALPNYFLNYEYIEKIELLKGDMDYETDIDTLVLYEKNTKIKRK